MIFWVPVRVSGSETSQQEEDACCSESDSGANAANGLDTPLGRRKQSVACPVSSGVVTCVQVETRIRIRAKTSMYQNLPKYSPKRLNVSLRLRALRLSCLKRSGRIIMLHLPFHESGSVS